MGLEINPTWPFAGQMSFEATAFLKYGISTKIMTKAKNLSNRCNYGNNQKQRIQPLKCSCDFVHII